MKIEYKLTSKSFLQVYNNALKINADCRTKDALEFLTNGLKEIHIQHKDDTDIYLEGLLKGTSLYYAYEWMYTTTLNTLVDTHTLNIIYVQ